MGDSPVQINQVFSYQNHNSTQQKQMSFKSAYPVYYWVKGCNGKYQPVYDMDTARTLHKMFVGYMNHSTHKSKNPEVINRLQAIWSKIASVLVTDRDYNISSPKVKSFYNKNGGKWYNGVLDPISYVITGQSSELFCDNYCKPIGRVNRKLTTEVESDTQQYDDVCRHYRVAGLEFIRNVARNFRNNDKEPLGLHVKIIPNKNESGEIKYEFEDLRFLPDEGDKNPCKQWFKRYSRNSVSNEQYMCSKLTS